MTRRLFLVKTRILLFFPTLFLALLAPVHAQSPRKKTASPPPVVVPNPTFDVLVYGATAAGIGAALNAAEFGHRVALIEPTARIGGIITNGLSLTDIISLESVSGFFKDYTDRAHQHYVRSYGADSPQAKASFFGTLAEPKVSLQVFRDMLAEQPNV
ncbi:MAG: FAD-dependent oxidoreductase, partial [Cytophagaceae bacterium]|nr:FAD-dependent oxidoreductase [Cytophagaceae bacterium]